MRAPIRCMALLVMLAALAAASTQTTDDLKARADNARGGEQVKLCTEYARQQLEVANKLFDEGDAEKGQATIRQVVEYARKAADAAASSGKHVKDTEIKLRKLADRMHDVAESLAFEGRQPVRQAVEDLQKIRSDLMVKMWGPESQPKGNS